MVRSRNWCVDFASFVKLKIWDRFQLLAWDCYEKDVKLRFSTFIVCFACLEVNFGNFVRDYNRVIDLRLIELRFWRIIPIIASKVMYGGLIYWEVSTQIFVISLVFGQLDEILIIYLGFPLYPFWGYKELLFNYCKIILDVISYTFNVIVDFFFKTCIVGFSFTLKGFWR